MSVTKRYRSGRKREQKRATAYQKVSSSGLADNEQQSLPPTPAFSKDNDDMDNESGIEVSVTVRVGEGRGVGPSIRGSSYGCPWKVTVIFTVWC